MQRIPEPELMTGLEQARAYAEADFNDSDQAFLARVRQLFPEGLGERLVDLGCGPGNISFRLAFSYPAAAVFALDGSAPMLALAERLRFVQAVLPDPALPGGASALLSNSLLHHLHDPGVLWRSLRQLAAPGAAVYVKDLRRPACLADAEALRARYLADAPPVLQHDYLASLQAAFTPEEVAAQLSAAGLDGLHVASLEDRYLEVWGRLD